ncbi:diaminopimelate epimerase [Demequina muriae]|uniref:Diaminopimelate epimerase n=1 Tax=Demequina muriae TaxID=3051664 RepID=A0ABT8GDP6_9MICO|nr:diaminopimelate epimerase [Demequina sp. EGI L300058]MDN4479547.1 diaminopimelate epimerase [Demequina sp. EGI L300058]
MVRLHVTPGLRFTKGHGTENDFVLLFDEHGEIDLTPALVRYLCDRRAGIGADGVIRAVRAGSVPAGAGLDARTWFMDYWNADGSTSEMCGNGARVFAALLERDAGVDLAGGLTIATRGGTRTLSSLGGGRYAVGMGEFRLGDSGGGFDAEVEARGLVPARPALSVDVGNPHHVVALASTSELEALDLTEAPRVTPTPPAGSNVEFVVTRGGEVRDGIERGRVRMRVHERGSGETRSCGTGACAVAVAVRSWAGDGAPDIWDVEVPGGMVTVRIVGTRTVLEGPALLVADGEVDVSGVPATAPTV